MYHGYWARKIPIFMRYSLDRKSGVWNVSSPERERELAKYKFDYVEVQEVCWNKDGTEPADVCIFLRKWK
jgi:hypothetical protein